MVVVEILVGLIIAFVILTGITKIASPIAEAFSERLKLKYQEIGPEEERLLKARVSALEEEVRVLKQSVANVQSTADFAVKLLEDQRANDASPSIKIVSEKEKS